MESSVSPGRWLDGRLPANTRVGLDSVITGDYAFKRFLSRLDPALVVGAHCTLDGVHFALGAEGRLTIGDYCYFTNAVLLCELEVRIGNYVVIGWNATILKGVRVGAGAFVEAGALVTRDVPAGMRVIGNPAQIAGKVE